MLFSATCSYCPGESTNNSGKGLQIDFGKCHLGKRFRAFCAAQAFFRGKLRGHSMVINCGGFINNTNNNNKLNRFRIYFWLKRLQCNLSLTK